MTRAASRDQNNIPGKLAVLNTDTVQGTNLVRIGINPSDKSVRVSFTATIPFTMKPIDPRDENYVACWLFQGSDGKTYPAVATASGQLLVEQ